MKDEDGDEYTLSDDDLRKLVERCTPGEIPPCRVCGAKLSIQSCGGRRATKWGCSGYEDDPDKPGCVRMNASRRLADDHYSESCWEEPPSWDYRTAYLARELLKARAPVRAEETSEEFIAAADALRRTIGKPWEFDHGHSNLPPSECPVCQCFREFDRTRACMAVKT